MDIDIVLDSQLPSARLTELGLLAEQHGIHAVWCASYLDGRDPFGNLAELARASSRIRLGPIALSPYELHPFRIAMALLTLNELCPGRAQAIIGGGGEVVMALEIPRDRRVRAAGGLFCSQSTADAAHVGAGRRRHHDERPVAGTEPGRSKCRAWTPS